VSGLYSFVKVIVYCAVLISALIVACFIDPLIDLTNNMDDIDFYESQVKFQENLAKM